VFLLFWLPAVSYCAYAGDACTQLIDASFEAHGADCGLHVWRTCKVPTFFAVAAADPERKAIEKIARADIIAIEVECNNPSGVAEGMSLGAGRCSRASLAAQTGGLPWCPALPRPHCDRHGRRPAEGGLFNTASSTRKLSPVTMAATADALAVSSRWEVGPHTCPAPASCILLCAVL